ncbi:hypothetical protein PAMP_007212 [Pampus punctatissimus]
MGVVQEKEKEEEGRGGGAFDFAPDVPFVVDGSCDSSGGPSSLHSSSPATKRKKSIRSSSSWSNMSFLCVLWLLAVCLAPGSRGQRMRETEGERAAGSAQLAERDAVCHQKGCYAVFFQKRTFREAGRRCRERGGTLATMHNLEAAGVVHDLLSGIKAQGTKVRFHLWIGLHRVPRQCTSTKPLRGFVWETRMASSPTGSVMITLGLVRSLAVWPSQSTLLRV